MLDAPTWDRLRSILHESGLVSLTMVDRTGQIVYANAAAAAVLGISPEEITSREFNAPAWKITDWDGNPVPDHELPFQRVLETRREVRDVRHAIVWPNGDRKQLAINGVPVLDDEGEVRCVWFVVADVTAETEAVRARDASSARLRRVDFVLESARELAGIGSWCLDFTNGRVDWCPRMAAMHGIELEDFEATFDAAMAAIHPDDREFVVRESEEIIATRSPRPVAYRIVRPGGEIRHVWGEGCFEFDAAGEPKTFFGFLQDVTERVHREEELRLSRERLELAVEATRLGLWDWNVVSGEAHYSPCCATMLGFEPDEIEPNVEFWESRLHPDDAPTVWTALERHLADERFEYETEYRLRCKDGEYIWIRGRGRATERDADGRALRMIGTVEDVDDRKRADLALAEAKRTAEAASEAKSALLANASHELRTPLTSIIGFAEMLLDESIGDEERRSAAHTVRRNGEHLLAIINDILDLSRIESGRVSAEREPCSPWNLVEEVRELMQVRLVGGRVKFRTKRRGPVPETILTDPLKLRQILINLVGNALKFTIDGEVCIHLSTDSAAGRLEIGVADTGIGIAENRLDELFQPFVQEDVSASRQHAGTGLGLSICKRLAELLGGDIRVESTPGAGSTFTVSLPIVTTDEESNTRTTAGRTSRPTSPDGPETLRVLVVDDGEDNRRLIRYHLQRAGFEIAEATGGAEALQMIDGRTDTFDAVLMDIRMPQMDGYETTRRFRDAGFERPIIALTADAMPGVRERCLDAGCNEYATKPIDGPVLVELVRGLACRTVE